MSVLLFAFAFVFFQDSPTALESALLSAAIASQNAVEADAKSEIRMYQESLKLAKNAVIKPDVQQLDQFGAVTDGRYFMPNKKNQVAAIAFYRDRVQQAESKAKALFADMLPILDSRRLEKGQAGFLGDSVSTLAMVKVLQVVDDSTFLGVIAGETILFKDASTENVVDGKFIKLSRAVEVVGTERYTTVSGGSNTVFCVRLIPRDDLIKALEYVEKNKRQLKREFRDWKGIDGKVIINAEYVSQEKSFVVVVDEAGREEKIAIAKLSKDDRNWLKDR